MKKSNKKWLFLPLLFLVLASVAVGTVLAFLTDAEEKVNRFTYGKIGVELKEPEWDGLEPEDKVVYPDRAVPKDPFVTNTGTVEIYAYLEIRIPMATVRTVSEDGKTILPAAKQELFRYTAGTDWTLIDESFTDTEHVLVYAYTKGQLRPGESSSPLFEEIRFLNMLEGELPEGTELAVPLRTFAIQSDYLEASGSTLAEKLRNAYQENQSLFKEGGSGV